MFARRLGARRALRMIHAASAPDFTPHMSDAIVASQIKATCATRMPRARAYHCCNIACAPAPRHLMFIRVVEMPLFYDKMRTFDIDTRVVDTAYAAMARWCQSDAMPSPLRMPPAFYKRRMLRITAYEAYAVRRVVVRARARRCADEIRGRQARW